MLKERRNKKIVALAAVLAVVLAAGWALVSGWGPSLGTASGGAELGSSYFMSLFGVIVLSGLVALGYLAALVRARPHRHAEDIEKHIAAVENSMDGIAIFDDDGTYLFVNQAYAAINGYSGPGDLVGKTFRTVYEGRSITIIEQVISPAIAKSGMWRGELIAKRKNGSTYFQEVSVTRLEGGGRVCIVRDITWRKRSETRLRRSEQFLNMIFNSIRDPFCIFDSEFQVIRANEAYAQLKNRTVDDLIGRKCHEALEGRDRVCEGCVVDKSFQSKDPCAKEKRILLSSGQDVWVEIYTYPILDEEGNVSYVIEYTRDITDRKRAEDERRRLIEKLEHLSRTDALTGLMNRRALTESLSYEIDRSGRYGSDLALLLCDIDNFKKINDTYGHDAGDQALQTISGTLKTLLRKPDIAGRYGGDEFMIILPETDRAGAEHLAEKLNSAIAGTELTFPHSEAIRLSMSIGLASLREGTENVDSFIKRADERMYTTKQSRKKSTKSSPPRK